MPPRRRPAPEEPKGPGEPGAEIVPAEQGGGFLAPLSPDLYREWLGGKCHRTLRAYRANILRLADWCGLGSGEEFFRWLIEGGSGQANRFAMKFKGEKQKLGWAPAYINNHLAALRSLLKFARLSGLIEWGVEVSGLKVEATRDTRGPGLDGMIALIGAARKGPAAKRNTAIMMIFASMALRRDEVCSLDLEHVDLSGSRALVKRKGKSQRIWLTMPTATKEAVSAWIEERGREPGPLFKSFGVGKRRDDGRLAESSFNWLIDKLASEAGIGEVHVHGLRHAAITEMLDATNGNVAEVQKFAGHDGPTMTMRYDDNRKDVAGALANKLAKKLMEGLDGEG